MTGFSSNKFYPPNSSTPIRRVSRPGVPGGHYLNFIPGDEWFDTLTKIWWKYLYFDPTLLGVWGQLATPGGDLDTLTGDVGAAVTPLANNINVQGGISGAIEFSNGGIGQMNAQVLVDGTTIAIVANRLAVVGGGFTWNTISVAGPTLMVTGEGYIANTTNPTVCSLLLPVTAAVGASLQIVGRGTGGFTITQNAGQQIFSLYEGTTIGIGGSLASTTPRNCLELVCTVTDTTWTIVDSNGGFTVV